MNEFLEAEHRLKAALSKLEAGVTGMRPTAEVFSSRRSTQGELDKANSEIAALREEIEARDATLMQLKSDASASDTDAVANLQAEVQALASANAVLTAERDHLRNLETPEVQSDNDPDADAKITSLQAEIKTLSRALEGVDATQQQLKASNAALRKANKDLHAAYKEQMNDPSALNAALEQSLRSIEAERAAERAELDAFREIVTPLLKDAANA